MSDPPLPRGDVPPLAPLAEAPAAAPTDRAAAEAAERASVEAAIERFNVNYNQNGGPPLPRLFSPIRRPSRSSTGTSSGRRPGSSSRTAPAAP